MLRKMKNKLNEKYTFYLENIEQTNEYLTDKTFENEEKIQPLDIIHDDDLFEVAKKTFNDYKYNNTIYYISDIHLDHKIQKHFPRKTTKEKIENYIKTLVEQIVNDLNHNLYFSDYLVICGDVSFNFEIAKMFYRELVSYRSVFANNIIVVLGNHELWEDGNYETTLKKYKDLFNELNITFLENELLLVKGKGLGGSIIKIAEDEIINSTDEELRKLCIDSKLTILGGLGFSGLNPIFNANRGLYRNAIDSLELDKALSSRFEKLYLKLKNAINDKEIVILTHTPKNDWSKDNFNNKWIYVNGHTHRNEYYKDETRIVYADNQIGYHNDKFKLKHFNTSCKYDIFKYYKDGIYEISKEDYVEFIYGVGIKMTYNRDDGTIVMLKRDGIYLFLLNKDNKALYLLDGGNRKKLNILEINYYYENMTFYSKKIKESTKNYSNFMKEVANYVKSFGGYGTIHGCIVDIDFFNHLYINPYDGTITPYYATSIIDKYLYKNIDKLLANHCQNLYLNYKKLNQEKHNIISKGNNEIKIYDFEHYESTAIYRESRVMKALQYLLNDNIIRFWNDDLISNKDTLENFLIENKSDEK